MTKIEIDDITFSTLEIRAKEKGKKTEAYINELLEQVANKLGKQKETNKEDEEKVKQRLKHLGYL